MKGRNALLSQAKVEAVTVANAQDIRRAAEALQRIALECAMRGVQQHDIADKRTPTDTTGNMRAHDVVGWHDEARVWWRSSATFRSSTDTVEAALEVR